MELKDGVDHPMEINIDSIVREVVRVVHEEQRENASRLNKRMQLKEAQFFSEEYVEIPDLAPGDILVKMEGSVIGDEELHRFLNGVDSQEQIGKWGTGRVVRMEGALSDCNNEKIQLNDSVVFRRQPASRLTGDKTNYGFCNWNQQFIRIRDSKILEVINGISQESRLLYPFVSVVLADFERLEKLYHFEKNDKFVVVGCTLRSLLLIAIMRSKGYSQVMVIDDDAQHLHLAIRFGAREKILYENKKGLSGIVERMAGLWEGELADYVICCLDRKHAISYVKKFCKKTDELSRTTVNGI